MNLPFIRAIYKIGEYVLINWKAKFFAVNALSYSDLVR